MRNTLLCIPRVWNTNVTRLINSLLFDTNNTLDGTKTKHSEFFVPGS
uniref:Uncharacterized protein n=1 Tax=Anguilla anguilla TaxID=7936 RepID=A0A0E9WAT2_ANGAN